MASNKNKEERATVVDNLDNRLSSASAKIAKNKKIIYICVGLILAVGAFVLSYIFIYLNPRLQNSWEAYNKVVAMEKRDNLDAAKLADEYRKVATNFSSTPAGDVSALAAAEYYYDAKNYDEAIKLLKDMGIGDPVLKAQSQALLGDCYVNKKQYEDALAAFDQAIKTADGNPALVPAYMFKKGVIYDHQKKYDDAISCFEDIKKNYPTFMGAEIDFYIESEKAQAGK